MDKKEDRAYFENFINNEKFDIKHKFDNEKIKIYKKTKGKIKNIDLHGLNRYQAERKVEALLRNERILDTEKLIFICGRGKHSSFEPVLKKTVKKILNRMKDYFDDYIEDENGNFHVHLR